MKRLMIGSIFSLLAVLEGKSVDSIRRLIIIAAAIVLSTPAIGQGYGGPSAEEIRGSVQDAFQDAVSDAAVQDAIRDAVRDGILAAARQRSQPANGILDQDRDANKRVRRI